MKMSSEEVSPAVLLPPNTKLSKMSELLSKYPMLSLKQVEILVDNPELAPQLIAAAIPGSPESKGLFGAFGSPFAAGNAELTTSLRDNHAERELNFATPLTRCATGGSTIEANGPAAIVSDTCGNHYLVQPIRRSTEFGHIPCEVESNGLRSQPSDLEDLVEVMRRSLHRVSLPNETISSTEECGLPVALVRDEWTLSEGSAVVRLSDPACRPSCLKMTEEEPRDGAKSKSDPIKLKMPSSVAGDTQHQRSKRRVTDSAGSSSMGNGTSIVWVPSDDNEWEIDPGEIELGRRIGIGSYGEVFKGTYRFTDVAVKRILGRDASLAVVEDFKAEIAIMRRLRHPNIVQFMGAITRPPSLCIVTQYVARGSLFKLLHRTPTFQPDERRRLQMALDIARGMNYLHSCKPPIAHRDLKSPNLLVDRDMTVKVCDFGLSLSLCSRLLTARSKTGTPEWTAPEVLKCQTSDAKKSDVYSFGVILWELMTNEEPWPDKTPLQVVAAVGWGNERLPIPQDCRAGIRDLIGSCFAEEDERPSFSEIIVVVKTAIHDLGPPPSVTSPTHQSGSSFCK